MSSVEPLPGTRVTIALTPREGDLAVVRVIAAPQRDMVRAGTLGEVLRPFADALLVDVAVEGRLVLPGAWVQREVLQRGTAIERVPVAAGDLRPPAVIAGTPERAALHWGETVWPLALGGVVAIPSAARAAPHPLSRLRRLVMVALGRRQEIALTLWQDPDLEIPWHDVRLLPHAARWFELAQVPTGARYADAERIQGVGRARSLS
ncbi:hypothetical protein BH708_02215 [Brachybacterium sp. P6-10-X1]|uniref:hypothetical protein n=1 Tax=Brachybacterium sp. P6-10-X1 TaxID=1903186 RepID=UPI000971B91C|nr:hypothetical protein [Brachybacterium sp. P6-10-X1]APX31728.1 hypothetical protein BH708_02215 [Brachybacterium sp. P6-10-X1]